MNSDLKKRTLLPNPTKSIPRKLSSISSTTVLSPMEVAKLLQQSPVKVSNPSLNKISVKEDSEEIIPFERCIEGGLF